MVAQVCTFATRRSPPHFFFLTIPPPQHSATSKEGALPLPATEADGAPGVTFALTFGDHMLLQRGDATPPVVYGTVHPPDAPVNATIDDDAGRSYSVAATTLGDGSWRVALTPREVGGNVTITARSAATSSGGESTTTSNATLPDVTFGDVWLCSGQSNMELALRYTVERNASYDALAVRRPLSLALLSTTRDRRRAFDTTSSNGS